MGFQKVVEGGVSAFLRPYRRMMDRLQARIAALSPQQAAKLDKVVIGINTFFFLAIVVCMWTNTSRWIQFALAVALYIGYQVFHRALHDRAKG
ncbi:MAG: hypothetical protein K2P94_18290 [Rhodospirillaceae bacterium]|nr:hypothetical protein [Rhodospirillaceae bacterium]